MTVQNFYCFYRQQLPVPGSHAQAVTYPACEWREAGDAADVSLHPRNRFVCSWLTSDVAEVSRCDEVLQAMAQIEAGNSQAWFADGDAFHVEFRAAGVQFNPSHVEPEDTAYWNQSEAWFTRAEVHTLLRAWRDFLVNSEQSATH
jgi:hypothetical protein